MTKSEAMELRIGDEILVDMFDKLWREVVTNTDGGVCTLDGYGGICFYGENDFGHIRCRTGRKFPELEKMVKLLREGE